MKTIEQEIKASEEAAQVLMANDKVQKVVKHAIMTELNGDFIPEEVQRLYTFSIGMLAVLIGRDVIKLNDN